jgi:catechol-2,3-dioxygenase
MTFDHIAMTAENIPATVQFYQTNFPEVNILYSDPTWALLEIGGTKVAFVVESQHPPHIAFRVDSRDELEKLAREANAKIDIHRDASESFYKVDVDGNSVEIIYYPLK